MTRRATAAYLRCHGSVICARYRAALAGGSLGSSKTEGTTVNAKDRIATPDPLVRANDRDRYGAAVGYLTAFPTAG
ncbi:MAG: hypothetical protein AB7P21_17135 [Lautropia sp.]